MDVNRSQSTNHLRAQERYREAMVDLVRRTRGKVQEAREEAVRNSAEDAAARRTETTERMDVESRPAATDRRDRIDISETLHARVRAAGVEEADEAVRPQVERLKHAYRTGTLNTPERVERAAENLLRNAAPEAADRAAEARADAAKEAHQAHRIHAARRGNAASDPSNA